MAGQRSSTLIDVDDAEFMSTLKTAFSRMKMEGEAGLMKVAVDVTNRAKGFCPVDTGELRSSIAFGPIEHDRSGAYIMVGTDVEYAPFVEFGTSRMDHQPFMRPALAEASGGAFQLVGGVAVADDTSAGGSISGAVDTSDDGTAA